MQRGYNAHTSHIQLTSWQRWPQTICQQCAQVTCGVTAPKQSTTGEEAKVPQAALRSIVATKSQVIGRSAGPAKCSGRESSDGVGGQGGALGRRWHRGNLCGRKMTKFQAWSCRYSRKRRKPKPSC
eukprot:s2403_g7.t1